MKETRLVTRAVKWENFRSSSATRWQTRICWTPPRNYMVICGVVCEFAKGAHQSNLARAAERIGLVSARTARQPDIEAIGEGLALQDVDIVETVHELFTLACRVVARNYRSSLNGPTSSGSRRLRRGRLRSPLLRAKTGGEGSRTPVLKAIATGFYMLIRLSFLEQSLRTGSIRPPECPRNRVTR
jgi:hypothetical protein